MPDFLYDWVLLLHVIGAVGLGYYLILPLILRRTIKLSGASLLDYTKGVYGISRVMQYVLLVQFITGGYIMGGNYSVAWMIISIGIIVLIGAISGMMNGKLKKAIHQLQSGGKTEEHFASIRLFSWIVMIALILILYYMMNPQYA